MPSYRVPILLWQDHSGLYNACPVEPPTELVGTALTPAAAQQQVKDYLDWSFRRDPWQPVPDFWDPRLVEVTVPIRPYYRDEERTYPCDELLELRVTCVLGTRKDGLQTCAAPLVGVRFDYYRSDSFSDLVQEHLRGRLAALTPQQLSRYLPPRSVELRESGVRVRHTWGDRRLGEVSLPTLELVAEPLGQRGLRRRFSRAWLREREVVDLVERLTQERASVILVGEHGAGKSTLLVEAARESERRLKQQRSAEQEEDQHRVRHRFWMTSAARIIAGMQYLGEWEARCEELISELSRIRGVLCVENLLDLVRTGGREPTESIASFLRPYVQSGELRVVAEASPQELQACERLLPGFADLFQKQIVNEFRPDEALQVLQKVVTGLQQQLGLGVAEDVVDSVYRLFRRFMPYHTFPGPAAQFLRDLLDSGERDGLKQIEAGFVRAQFARQTGLPELFLRDDLSLDAEQAFSRLSAQVIGQEWACRSMAHLITTFKVGLNDPARPVGVRLFCGPTGVGKTELAKAVARFCFGSGREERLVRLDMSEYSGFGAADRLLSQPDGRPSRLIERLRQQPFSVVLLDEIEKAAPEVFDVLLNVFEEGRLTDPYGRVTWFRSAILIMTSNLGATNLKSIGFAGDALPSYAREAMAFFRPEFFNRIDEVVTFHPLDEAAILAITRKELDELNQREALRESGLRLRYDDDVVRHIARHGFDARYGARPLQWYLETHVVTPISRLLIGSPGLSGAEIQLKLGSGGIEVQV